MMAYGAQIARIRGFGADPAITRDVFPRLAQRGRRAEAALQVSAFVLSPLGMAGVQTLAYELAEQLPAGIDHVFCPAGGGGLCVAAARGFEVLAERGALARPPRVHCVQPWGNDTIAGPLREGAAEARETRCTTQISGLQVASVLDGHLAVAACRASGGTGYRVDDERVWELQRRLARTEGIFAEPAGVVALAGAAQAAAAGEAAPDDVVVCTVTGSGFKDMVAAERLAGDRECPTVDIAALDGW
jgi:threonine synthase